MKRFAALVVAGVGALGGGLRLVVTVIPEMLLHLGIQAAIDHGLQHMALQLAELLGRHASLGRLLRYPRPQRQITAPRRPRRSCSEGSHTVQFAVSASAMATHSVH